MSVQPSTNRFEYDDETALAPFASPQTLAASGASSDFISLDVLTSYWASGDLAQELDLAVVIEVQSVSGTAPQCVFNVQVAADSGAFTSPFSVGATITATGTGRYVVIVDRSDIFEAIGATLLAATNPVGSLRLYGTLSGTSPSFTYYAYVTNLTGL